MEELKVIVDTISSLGDGAMTAFIIWVAVKYGLSYLMTIVLVSTFIFTAYKLLYLLITQHSFVGRIKNIMDFHGELIPREKREIIETLQRGKK